MKTNGNNFGTYKGNLMPIKYYDVTYLGIGSRKTGGVTWSSLVAINSPQEGNFSSINLS